jgi:hypothetical protein
MDPSFEDTKHKETNMPSLSGQRRRNAKIVRVWRTFSAAGNAQSYAMIRLEEAFLWTQAALVSKFLEEWGMETVRWFVDARWDVKLEGH